MSDARFMRLALRLARLGYGMTSPNPMVGALLVKRGRIIGRGWHRGAGLPHAEIEALRDAQKRGYSPRGATLYVTLEPCSTHGRTPPCTDAIVAAEIKRVVVGAVDPNPKHAGRAFRILGRVGMEVEVFDAYREPRAGSSTAATHPTLAGDCARLNEPFNHWIVQRTPFVTVKAAMTLDGKIATANGESKWITGAEARAYGMKLRQGADAILVGVNTVLSDDPSLTIRPPGNSKGNIQHSTSNIQHPMRRRIVLDSMARTPLAAKVVSDEFAPWTTIVVSKRAPKKRVAALAGKVNVLVAPTQKAGRAVFSPRRRARSDAPCRKINLRWLLKILGGEKITSLLVEGGGEVNASFLLGGLAQRIAFFYAPTILGGRDSRKAVAGEGVARPAEVLELRDLEWRKLGRDLLLTARVG